MNNKLPCDIVQDLLPSYVDGLTKDTTNEAIETHLESCEVCKKSLNSMKETEEVHTSIEEKEEIDFLKKTKKKHVGTIITSIITVAIIGVFLYFINAFFGNPVSYMLAKDAAEKYVETEYGDMDVYIEKVGYSFKFPSYYAIVKSDSSVDTYFTVYISMMGEVEYDTYDSVTSGWRTYNRIDQEYRALVDEALSNPGFPLESNIAYGTLEMDEIEVGGYKPVKYGVVVSDLEVDRVYDIIELGKTAGHIICYVDQEEVSIERMAEYMLLVKAELDKAGVPFYAMDFALMQPIGEEYDYTDNERMELYVHHFLYSDIYEEGMVERVQMAYEDLDAYYTQMDSMGK